METSTDQAREAYDAMAPIYDEFTSANDYARWFDTLFPWLERLGLDPLPGDWLLDVACGTGRAFEPMRARGWNILGCDVSPAMIERAREKFAGTGIALDVADMRSLPVYLEGGFKLVWALNDPVNYLLEDGDLRLALERMGANLSGDGLLVLDTNTRALFEANYGATEEAEDGSWRWEGRGSVDGIYEARLSGPGFEAHTHRERHFLVSEVQAAMVEAGLEPVAALGQKDDAEGLVISDDWDEERDHKIVHVARRG